MSHSPLVLKNVGLELSHKLCFSGFSTQVHGGSKIAIIGNNGSGKSTLLKILQGMIEPTYGLVTIPANITFGYVPQTLTEPSHLSGGQRFNAALSQALSAHPDVLCLDEPTNHLDRSNRQSLMRMLKKFQGTLFVVSHDVELLRTCIDTIWHIDEGNIKVFSGSYDAYIEEHQDALENRGKKIEQLKRQKMQAQDAFAAEKQRAVHSKNAGKKENDRKLKGAMKESGSRTVGKNQGRIQDVSRAIQEELKNYFVPEQLVPKFSLSAAECSSSKALVTVTEGVCGYDQPVVQNIAFMLTGTDRIALEGDNGSGKSTIFKALLHDPLVQKSGTWQTVGLHDIGYLDQHYNILNAESSVLEAMQDVVPHWTIVEIRKHLNDFLFRKNEEVHTLVKNLSGGEKVRLSLALLAAKTPKLLLLDEVTNNLDIQTREYVIHVLSAYPGALLVISHDEDFLHRIGIGTRYGIQDGQFLFVQ